MVIERSISVMPWRSVLSDSDERLSDVIALGKRHRQTLGFLPDAVYEAAAESGKLVLAERDGSLVGYTLYRVSRSAIKLTHVCVDDAARGQGVGQRMIALAIEMEPGASEIVARCRRDYGLDRFWEQAGLSPLSERAGRNAKGLPLTVWSRPLGQPDLLTSSVLDSPKPIVVLDSNIIIDLHSSESVHRPDRLASQALLADWLDEEVTFAVSVQIDHELNDNPDAKERVYQSAGSQGWVRLPTSRPHDSKIESDLIAAFGREQITRDPSLLNDVKHVADAARSRARYFVTNDRGVLKLRERIREQFDLAVVRPYELINDILTESGALQSFAPGVFEHIDLQWTSPTEASEEDHERAFMNYSEGERGRDFRSALRAALTRPLTRHLADLDGRPVALLAEELSGGSLRVELLRVASGPHQPSISLQLARQLRLDALEAGATKVEVVDERLPRAMRGALREDGFLRRDDGTYHATPVDGQLALDVLPNRLSASGDPDLSALSWSEIEWYHWPLVVVDVEAPCYVIPIKPSAAMELFAYPANLLQQRRALGLSRRHVYFRSGNNNPIKDTPARILWYASTEGRVSVQEFFATSVAYASHVLPADEAHEQFGGLGTYKRSQIESVADKHGRVNVIEVEDTRLLKRPIGLKDFRSSAMQLGIDATFRSPRRIPSELMTMLLLRFNVSEVQ